MEQRGEQSISLSMSRIAEMTTSAVKMCIRDRYLLDAEGNILTGSDYYTYINGTAGTLPEALGYITSVSYTHLNPEYRVRYWDKEGNYTDTNVQINDVDPRNASYLEMLRS